MMTVDNNSLNGKVANTGHRGDSGWTGRHSWIFLLIVAIGLAVTVVQNRYHYLISQDNGKAYRVSKLSGSIQEFSSSDGWIAAQFDASAPRQVSQEIEPVPSQSKAVPMNARSGDKPEVVPEKPEEPVQEMTPPEASGNTEPPSQEPAEESAAPPTEQPGNQPVPEKPAMTREVRFKAFLEKFPDYTDQEFELADQDLFPDWKKRYAPDGNWLEFLTVYEDFIQWWHDQGSPAESGAKLWQDFMTSRGGR
ncbi:hypothetical protein ACFL2Q_00975 [Thermodesulfobacteriota bacterium]